MMIRPAFAVTGLALGALSLLSGCNLTGSTGSASAVSTPAAPCTDCGCTVACSAESTSIPVFELPTTAQEQSQATPDAVLDQLMAGNARYVAGQRTVIDIENSRAAGTKGQWPLAYVLSCVDSRVPVEVVFDQGIGDIFVGRVAGNYETPGQLGSMEFATAAAGSKLVMVLGHEACGAIKGSIDDVKLGNLTGLLAELKPAAEGIEGEKSSKNKAYVDAVIEANVRKTVQDLRDRSEVLAGLERQGKIKIVGAVYSLQTGEVTLLD